MKDIHKLNLLQIQKFTTGDKILYSPKGNPLLGITEGVYYIKKISSNTVELYASLSAINSGGKLEFFSANFK